MANTPNTLSQTAETPALTTRQPDANAPARRAFGVRVRTGLRAGEHTGTTPGVTNWTTNDPRSMGEVSG